MDIKKITDNFSTSPQIAEEDVAKIAELGYRCIINNRPDNEGEDQTLSNKIQELAENNGLEYHHLPVISGNITQKDVSDFGEILKNSQTPTLAFCRSGTRSTILWASSQASELGEEEVIAKAANAGYDIKNHIIHVS